MKIRARRLRAGAASYRCGPSNDPVRDGPHIYTDRQPRRGLRSPPEDPERLSAPESSHPTAMRRSPFLALALALLASPAASAQIQGIGYRFNPMATYVDFEGDAALSDGLLYGGGVGLSFGEFFELGGSYLYGGSFETDFSGLSGLEDDPTLQAALAGLAPRDVNVQRYGGDLKVNLATTAIVPYLTVGTGIVRLGPDGEAEATRSIYLLGGAGVQLTLADRYALSVSAEDFAYRYTLGSAFFRPEDFAATGLTTDNFSQVTTHNLAVRAAARVYLGGRRPGDFSEFDRAFQRQFSGGLAGLSVVLEPFYARANFNEVLPYRDQAFVGGEAGFDFGPLVGLRGFYGRGIDTSDPTSFEGIQMYGGDIRFRLSEGRGLVPFLSVGGGYLDVLGGYGTDEGAEPRNATAEDNPFAAGGAGVAFLLSPRFRAIAEVRGLLMSTQDEEDVSRPEDVYLSTLFRGGVSFGLGGKAGRRVDVVRRSELDAQRDQMEIERMQMQAQRDSMRAEMAALEVARNQERARALARQNAREAAFDARIDSARAAGDADAVARLRFEQGVARQRAAEARDAAGDAVIQERRWMADFYPGPAGAVEREVEVEEVEAAGERMVTIPLPREGELYVRYGPPGGVVIEDVTPAAALRATVRDALRDVLAEDPTIALSDDELEAVVDRVAARLAPGTVSGRQLAPVTGATPAGVTRSDLDALERRLEVRFLNALREVLADPTPVDPKARAADAEGRGDTEGGEPAAAGEGNEE